MMTVDGSGKKYPHKNSRSRRKPWPQNAVGIYVALENLAKMINRDLLELLAKNSTFDGETTDLQYSIALIRQRAYQIQNACHAYDISPGGRRARWAGWAVIEIDLLAGGIIRALNRAEDTMLQANPDKLVLRRMITDALNLAPLIEKQLYNGPPPVVQPLMAEIEAIADTVWDSNR